MDTINDGIKNNKIHEVSPTLLQQSQFHSNIEWTADQIFTQFNERIKKLLNGREDRGLKLAIGGHVNHKTGRIFSVRSENNQHAYLVDLDRKSCTCPDSKNGYICKHRIAAYLVEQSLLAANPDNYLDSNPEPEYENGNAANEKLEIAKAILDAKSQFLKEAIIYARIPNGEETLNVEIISMNDDTALVRALPLISNASDLVPQFPFHEGQSSVCNVLTSSLMDITIYR